MIDVAIVGLKVTGRRADTSPMRHRRVRAGWVSLLVVAVGSAGVAAALPGSSLRNDASTSLAATNVGDGAAVADQTTTTAATSLLSTTPTASATAPPPTTRLTPTTGAGSVPATARSVPTTARPTPPSYPAFTSTTVAPGQPAQTVPPPVNPPAWTFSEDGVSVRLRMTPTAPRVGDTVEFTIETWTDLPGVTCCNVMLRFSQDTVFRRWPEIGPCPERPPREARVSYRITEPTVFPIPMPYVTVLFLLSVSTTFDPCAGLQPASKGGEFGVPVVVRLPGT